MIDPEKPFPILNGPIPSVPWIIPESCRGQLRRNHGQTVERLAERGGLGVLELAGALTGRRWGRLRELTDEQAMAVINRRIEVLK